MKAIILHAFGDPDQLLHEDVPVPVLGPDDILVEVEAAGVNPVDAMFRSGRLQGRIDLPLPAVPGWDVVGVVRAVGSTVSGFPIGKRVVARIDPWRGGGYAEFVSVASAHAATAPSRVPAAVAAGLPLAGLTAWQALFDAGRLRPGETVLVVGGSGGVGHLAVQLAHWGGARVLATASRDAAAFVTGLGATTIIDRDGISANAGGIADLVLDTVGGAPLDEAFAWLRPGGRLVSIVQPPDPERLAERGATGCFFYAPPNGALLARLVALVDDGVLQVHVAETLPLAAAARAHLRIAEGSVRGKITLSVASVGAGSSGSQVVKSVSFRSAAGVKDVELESRSLGVTQVLRRQPGFMERRFCRCDDGLWLDLIVWRSKEEAETAEATARGTPEVRAFLELIERGSVSIGYAAVRQTTA